MGGFPGIGQAIAVTVYRGRPAGDGAEAAHLLRVANGLTALAE